MSDPFERLKTALADRYTIERELGRGGMATAYREVSPAPAQVENTTRFAVDQQRLTDNRLP